MRLRKILYSALLLLVVAATACAKGDKGARGYVIGFYNVENLFDTYHDEGKNDYEYLPDGANRWTDARDNRKLRNIATVIKAMADENKAFHTVLGLSEVENRHVLEDLVSQKEIADANYQIVHYDGPDRRGVDVALLYRPEQFKLIESKSIPFDFNSKDIKFDMDEESQGHFRTRDVLMVRGEIADFRRKFDYREVGGTALLGVQKPVIKAHGSSDAYAICSAAGQAIAFAESTLIQDIAANAENMAAGLEETAAE